MAAHQPCSSKFGPETYTVETTVPFTVLPFLGPQQQRDATFPKPLGPPPRVSLGSFKRPLPPPLWQTVPETVTILHEEYCDQYQTQRQKALADGRIHAAPKSGLQKKIAQHLVSPTKPFLKPYKLQVPGVPAEAWPS